MLLAFPLGGAFEDVPFIHQDALGSYQLVFTTFFSPSLPNYGSWLDDGWTSFGDVPKKGKQNAAFLPLPVHNGHGQRAHTHAHTHKKRGNL